MAYHKSLKSLFAKIENDMRDVLVDEVAEEVKEIQSRHVETDVYGAYTSQTPYSKRRGRNGGLADTDNMIHTVTSIKNGIELFIKNVTDSNPNVDYTSFTNPPNYLAGIIEYGRNKGLYTYNRTSTQHEYMQPRPFISNSIDEIKRTLLHVETMRKGLSSKGYKFYK